MKNLSVFNDIFNVQAFEKNFDKILDHWVSDYSYAPNKNGDYEFFLDVPGLKESDLKIETSGNHIMVSGSRKINDTTRSISKSFTLPSNCDRESIVAHLEDGVLTLTLKPLKPLASGQTKKVIPITSSK